MSHQFRCGEGGAATGTGALAMSVAVPKAAGSSTRVAASVSIDSSPWTGSPPRFSSSSEKS